MDLTVLNSLIIFLAEQQQQNPQDQRGLMNILILLPLMFLFMYFLVIRPNKNEEKKKKEMLGSLLKGDQVITSSGIHGKIVEFRDNNETVILSIAKDTNVTFSTSSVIKKKA